MLHTADKRDTFRKMHESGCFILPNPFDVGSARAWPHLGFKALASTSAGFAWTSARPTTASPSTTSAIISPRSARQSICPSMPISRRLCP